MSGFLPRRALLVGSAALALPLATRAQAPAVASPWPTQPIRLVVPFAPGGTTDLVARLLSQGLQDQLGQPVIIENRAGAGATVGSLAVAQAAPDGHTLLMSNIASHGVAPSLYRSLRYDALRDFTHIALVVENPLVFVANPRFPATTLAEVVRLSREDARGIDIASSGSGLDQPPADPAIRPGDRRAGEPRALSRRRPGDDGHDRRRGADDVGQPALRGRAYPRRLGAPPCDFRPGHGTPPSPRCRPSGNRESTSSARPGSACSGPAGLPPAVTERLGRAVAAVLADPALRARFAEIGGTVGTLGPAGYTDFVRAEVARWAPVVQASGAQVD